jgi:hypothetical protein
MFRSYIVRVWLVGVLVLLASLAIFARVALGGDAYTPAPPVAVPVQSELERHGLLIGAQHQRTKLVDGSGLALWNNPSCSGAPQVDDLQFGPERYAVLDPPAWVKIPPQPNAWLAVGIVSGMHIHFEAPVAKMDRVREIVQADPSVAFGSYCIYEEFYRMPGDPSAGGEAYWSRIQVAPPNPEPDYSVPSGYPAPPTHGHLPVRVDNSGWPAPAPTALPQFVRSQSFFPQRPAHVAIRYRTGILVEFGAGMRSGWTAIKDAAGITYGYYTGWPMYVDGKQTHCAIPPLHGFRYDPIGCDGGWPADIVIGVTRVRVYYWHDVTSWGQHVEVTDQIIRAPWRD